MLTSRGDLPLLKGENTASKEEGNGECGEDLCEELLGGAVLGPRMWYWVVKGINK